MPPPYRCTFFIDGFNYYHAIRGLSETDPKYVQLKWIDYVALAQAFLPRGCILSKVFCFTAYADWDQNKRNRHNLLLRANRRNPLFTSVLGKFKQRDRECWGCRRTIIGHEEK